MSNIAIERQELDWNSQGARKIESSRGTWRTINEEVQKFGRTCREIKPMVSEEGLSLTLYASVRSNSAI